MGKNKSHNKIDVIQDIDSVPSNVHIARQEVLLYELENNDQDCHQKKGSYNDTCFQPSELLLIGCLIELIWTPK